jgi:TRAP-type C4-dicarboxylate transport system permease small subunit
MDVVKSQTVELKKLWKNKRQLTFQLLNLAMIVFSALMIWKGLMVVTKSESPVVVVLRSVNALVSFFPSLITFLFQWFHGTCFPARRHLVSNQP